MSNTEYNTLLLIGAVKHLAEKSKNAILPISQYCKIQNPDDVILYDDRIDEFEHVNSIDSHFHKYKVVCDFMIEESDDNPVILSTYNDQFPCVNITVITNDMINNTYIEVTDKDHTQMPIIIRNGDWHVNRFA